TRGRAIARYAVFRHIRGNPETRYTVTCPYRYTLSTLPADATLALEGVRGGGSKSGDSQTLSTRSGFRRTWVRLGERGRRDRFRPRRGESLFSRESGYTVVLSSVHIPKRLLHGEQSKWSDQRALFFL